MKRVNLTDLLILLEWTDLSFFHSLYFPNSQPSVQSVAFQLVPSLEPCLAADSQYRSRSGKDGLTTKEEESAGAFSTSSVEPAIFHPASFLKLGNVLVCICTGHPIRDFSHMTFTFSSHQCASQCKTEGFLHNYCEGASIYDIHKILAFFDPTSPSL